MLERLLAFLLAEDADQKRRRQLLKEHRAAIRALKAEIEKGEKILSAYRKKIAAARKAAGEAA